ncbi:hypothetical protein GGF31_006276 [Allomyces arbusculus]|nr:hypothetical protein GGF31_006276 [Allomyces arbusculus]
MASSGPVGVVSMRLRQLLDNRLCTPLVLTRINNCVVFASFFHALGSPFLLWFVLDHHERLLRHPLKLNGELQDVEELEDGDYDRVEIDLIEQGSNYMQKNGVADKWFTDLSNYFKEVGSFPELQADPDSDDGAAAIVQLVDVILGTSPSRRNIQQRFVVQAATLFAKYRVFVAQREQDPQYQVQEMGEQDVGSLNDMGMIDKERYDQLELDKAMDDDDDQQEQVVPAVFPIPRVIPIPTSDNPVLTKEERHAHRNVVHNKRVEARRLNTSQGVQQQYSCKGDTKERLLSPHFDLESGSDSNQPRLVRMPKEQLNELVHDWLVRIYTEIARLRRDDVRQRFMAPINNWIQLVKVVKSLDDAAHDLAALDCGVQPKPHVALDRDHVVLYLVHTPTIVPNFAAHRVFVDITTTITDLCILANTIVNGEKEHAMEEVEAQNQMHGTATTWDDVLADFQALRQDFARDRSTMPLLHKQYRNLDYVPKTRGKKGEKAKVSRDKKLQDDNELILDWNGKIDHKSFKTDGYTAQLLRLHTNDAVAHAKALGGELKIDKWTKHGSRTKNRRNAARGSLKAGGFDEFAPFTLKNVNLAHYSGIRVIDPGHRSFLTCFEASCAEVEDFLDPNLDIDVNLVLETWDKQSGPNLIGSMFWDLSGSRARYWKGDAAHSKALTEFFANDAILAAYMRNKPTLKTCNIDDAHAAISYMSANLYKVMTRVLDNRLAKLKFRRTNRERSCNPFGITMPVKQFARRLIHAGLHVMLVDEYWTSKTCAKCGHNMEQIKKAWGSKRCHYCKRIRARDRSAAFNIFRSGVRDGLTVEVPPHWLHHPLARATWRVQDEDQQDDDDIAVAPGDGGGDGDDGHGDESDHDQGPGGGGGTDGDTDDGANDDDLAEQGDTKEEKGDEGGEEEEDNGEDSDNGGSSGSGDTQDDDNSDDSEVDATTATDEENFHALGKHRHSALYTWHDDSTRDNGGHAAQCSPATAPTPKLKPAGLHARLKRPKRWLPEPTESPAPKVDHGHDALTWARPRGQGHTKTAARPPPRIAPLALAVDEAPARSRKSTRDTQTVVAIKSTKPLVTAAARASTRAVAAAASAAITLQYGPLEPRPSRTAPVLSPPPKPSGATPARASSRAAAAAASAAITLQYGPPIPILQERSGSSRGALQTLSGRRRQGSEDSASPSPSNTAVPSARATGNPVTTARTARKRTRAAATSSDRDNNGSMEMETDPSFHAASRRRTHTQAASSSSSSMRMSSQHARRHTYDDDFDVFAMDVDR